MPPVPIAHLLFDADGVIQEIPGGWYAAMEPHVGDRSREFLHATWKDERPTLAGIGDYRPMLAATLEEYGVAAHVDDVLADVWYRIDPHPESLALVARLREAGYRVHLGTNQEPYRAAHMQTALGYADLFDTCFYSCELKAAKPDAGFFSAVVASLAAEPESILFIDDSERNVLAAREAGMRSVHWHLDAGHAALLEELAGHGVRAR
ncbi:HAD family hydrolase [Microbacterium sp. CIAB417]|uniref:HAD family hydrolase n=1 Tax=Microbacterium sp. CIAB417 TaxID=2860287 RepID=UPI001FAB7216|nr:HAD-IA family hydrolase [Microbacterium sp. CIAB417]